MKSRTKRVVWFSIIVVTCVLIVEGIGHQVFGWLGALGIALVIGALTYQIIFGDYADYSPGSYDGIYDDDFNELPDGHDKYGL